MTEQQKASGSSSSSSTVNDLQMEDLEKQRPARQGASTPSGDEAVLTARGEVDQSFHIIDASPGGEVQFRLPSRQAGRTMETNLEAAGPKKGMLVRNERRALEQLPFPNPAEHLHRDYRRELSRQESVSRPQLSHRSYVEMSPSRYTDLGEIVYDSNHRGECSNYGNHGIRGEPINVRESLRRPSNSSSWESRENRAFSPSFRPDPREYGVREMDMRTERGQQIFPGIDQPRPRYPDADPGAWRDTRRSLPTQPVVGGHDQRRGSRKNKKPATYDGSSNWADYLVQFELVADLNQWDDEEKALELATCLRGTAQGVLGDLHPDSRRNYRHLVAALNNRFQPDNQSEMYRAQMKNRLRKRGEPLSELCHDVKRLVRLAYPAAPLEVREHLARDCFIDSLNNSEMEWTVFQGKPATTDEAMRLALEFEAFQAGRKRRLDGKHDIRMQREEIYEEEDTQYNDLLRRVAKLETRTDDTTHKKNNFGPRPSGRACYYCSEVGHLIAKCPKRQQDLYMGNEQSRNYTPRQGNRNQNNLGN